MMLTGQATWSDGYWIIKPDQPPDQGWFDHLHTMNGNTDWFPVAMDFIDPRQARPKQRALFFALIHDIWAWSGEDEEFLKAYFYSRFVIKTAGREISLADNTKNTVSDARALIDDVVDFVFDYDVPVKAGMFLLPKEENHFQYQCISHRKCIVCGRHADIHHIDEIGAGRNRTHIDHTKLRLAALCQEHHTEAHKIGLQAFCNKYQLTNLGIRVDAATLRKIGVAGNYSQNQSI
ncbi:putative HNHc nuclease [Limosilactobacillus ingluviei]|uniref:putative HNHc nuclease n=1 Tax=Limosilactobacillus ingluviei TaxID=148604 RepID=UPI0023F13AA3|nr:putative HNHc nuclease [Limosilactobacillus ingluviei]